MNTPQEPASAVKWCEAQHFNLQLGRPRLEANKSYEYLDCTQQLLSLMRIDGNAFQLLCTADDPYIHAMRVWQGMRQHLDTDKLRRH